MAKEPLGGQFGGGRHPDAYVARAAHAAAEERWQALLDGAPKLVGRARGEAMLGRLDHYLRSYDRFMEADREKLRVHVKLGCPDGYSVDLGQIKGHFPYVGLEQVNVELVRGGLTHPTGSLANGGGGAEDIVVVNAAVSVTYHGGSL